MFSRIGLLFAVLPGVLAAQAMVEHAMGSAAAATATAPAAGVGKSIGAAFEKLGKTLDGAGSGSSTTQQVIAAPAARTRTAPANAKTRTVAAVEAPPPPPVVTYEDPAGIKEGMPYGELISRFGPPAMKLTTSGGETLSYATRTRSVDVQIANGKVASIQRTTASNDSFVYVVR